MFLFKKTGTPFNTLKTSYDNTNYIQVSWTFWELKNYFSLILGLIRNYNHHSDFLTCTTHDKSAYLKKRHMHASKVIIPYIGILSGRCKCNLCPSCRPPKRILRYVVLEHYWTSPNFFCTMRYYLDNRLSGFCKYLCLCVFLN